MKIKRFFAPDIRMVMKMVKDELGADAVIMSNRSVDGGVEIVAARDFDEKSITEKLDKTEQPRNASSSKPDVPAFKNDDQPLHVLSNSRKRGVDGQATEAPIRRRNEEPYQGYAEKVPLVKPTSVNKQSHASARTQVSSKFPVDDRGMAYEMEPLMQQMRNELRQEFSGIKSILSDAMLQVRGEQPVHPSRLQLLKRLELMGVTAKLAGKLANRLGSHKDVQLAFDKALEMLIQSLPIKNDPILDQGGVVALVGPTGVGKTTTLAKIAALYILRHGRDQVGLISMDNFRIGGQEQLKIYGRLLGIDVTTAKNQAELLHQLQHFNGKSLVLIDTAGMSQRDQRLQQNIKHTASPNIQIQHYLVLSAASQHRVIEETITAFQGYRPDAAILTKLDEADVSGPALSALIDQRLPLAFVTDGQHVPEDLHLPVAADLIGQCAGGIAPETDYTKGTSDAAWVTVAHA